MSRELGMYILKETGVSGVSDRADVNRIAERQVKASNDLQRKISGMIKEYVLAGKSREEAWAIVEQTPEWAIFTNDTELYPIDTNMLHRVIDKYESLKKSELNF